MPSSVATWVSGRPLDASSDTASRLNSSVNDRRVIFIINPPRHFRSLHEVSTKSGEGQPRDPGGSLLPLDDLEFVAVVQLQLPVRDIGRLNSARNRQSEGINKDVSLAPLHLLVPVKTAHTAALGRLHRLPIHDDDGRAFGAACGNPRPLVQRPLQLGPHTLGSPPTEIVIDRAARRIFAWQPPPLAAGAEQME